MAPYLPIFYKVLFYINVTSTPDLSGIKSEVPIESKTTTPKELQIPFACPPPQKCHR